MTEADIMTPRSRPEIEECGFRGDKQTLNFDKFGIRVSATLKALEQAIVSATSAQCTDIVGELGRLQALAHLRVMTCAPHATGQSVNDDTLLTIPEVAERLKVSRYRAYELVRRGEIKKTSVGTKSVRVTPSDLAAYLLARQGS